jgi:hypothetical protein
MQLPWLPSTSIIRGQKYSLCNRHMLTVDKQREDSLYTPLQFCLVPLSSYKCSNKISIYFFRTHDKKRHRIKFFIKANCIVCDAERVLCIGNESALTLCKYY